MKGTKMKPYIEALRFTAYVASITTTATITHHFVKKLLVWADSK